MCAVLLIIDVFFLFFSECMELCNNCCRTVQRYQMFNALLTVQRWQLQACCHLGMALEKIQEYDAATESYAQGVVLSQKIECTTKDRRNEIKCLMRISIVVMLQASTANEGIANSRQQSILVQAACQRPLQAMQSIQSMQDQLSSSSSSLASFDPSMLKWLKSASKTQTTRMLIADVWFVVHKKALQHYSCTMIQCM